MTGWDPDTQGPEPSFWKNLWKVTAVLNLLVGVFAVLWFGKRHLRYDADIKASDLVVIVLAAVTVVLAALALVLGGLAIWGFAEIKRAAELAARSTAKAVAADVALAVAGPVAAREALDSQRILQTGGDSAISERGPDDLYPEAP